MSVMLDLSCNGCEATARVGPLRMRFHGTRGDRGFGRTSVDDPETLAPDGWVLFDPYTYMTYCGPCWTSITARQEPTGGEG